MTVPTIRCTFVGDTTKRDLPWTATSEQWQSTQQCCIDMRAYDAEVCVPSGIYTVHFEKMFGTAGKPKTAEKLLLTGPYGKYLLEGCFHPPMQKVVFEYLDLLGAL